ncbi:hypothetical protein [Caulifigura coniformis]|uniref:hypothetical protein n=1 Tax=Caulifigura coniformis TaxID=2527983 RepID=UPI001E318258|nr:hypothetical protein [Caulifigura coniformis]
MLLPRPDPNKGRELAAALMAKYPKDPNVPYSIAEWHVAHSRKKAAEDLLTMAVKTTSADHLPSWKLLMKVAAASQNGLGDPGLAVGRSLAERLRVKPDSFGEDYSQACEFLGRVVATGEIVGGKTTKDKWARFREDVEFAMPERIKLGYVAGREQVARRQKELEEARTNLNSTRDERSRQENEKAEKGIQEETDKQAGVLVGEKIKRDQEVNRNAALAKEGLAKLPKLESQIDEQNKVRLRILGHITARQLELVRVQEQYRAMQAAALLQQAQANQAPQGTPAPQGGDASATAAATPPVAAAPAAVAPAPAVAGPAVPVPAVPGAATPAVAGGAPQATPATPTGDPTSGQAQLMVLAARYETELKELHKQLAVVVQKMEPLVAERNKHNAFVNQAQADAKNAKSDRRRAEASLNKATQAAKRAAQKTVAKAVDQPQQELRKWQGDWETYLEAELSPERQSLLDQWLALDVDSKDAPVEGSNVPAAVGSERGTP